MFYGEKGLNQTSICPEMKLYGKDFFITIKISNLWKSIPIENEN